MSGTAEKLTAQISLKVDQDLKKEAYDKLKKLGVKPSEFFRDMLEYVVKENRLPVSKEIISADDLELLELAKERINEKRVRVQFNDL